MGIEKVLEIEFEGKIKVIDLNMIHLIHEASILDFSRNDGVEFIGIDVPVPV